jgi:hypothetical protein
MSNNNDYLEAGFFSYHTIVVLGYTVTFIKLLTIYHSWIHPLHNSPLSFLPYSWNSFNRSHFPIYIYESITFLPHSPFYILSLYHSPSQWYQSPRLKQEFGTRPTPLRSLHQCQSVGFNSDCFLCLQGHHWTGR